MIPRVYVSKGWGYEDWIWNGDKFCGKKLFFKKGKRCSFHYHPVKEEVFYCHSGELLVLYALSNCVSEDGLLYVDPDVYQIVPNVDEMPWTLVPHDMRQTYAHSVILEAGDRFHVPPGLRHAMYGLTDVEMFEFSTHHEDEDSVRIQKGD